MTEATTPDASRSVQVGPRLNRSERLFDALVTGGGIAWRLAAWVFIASIAITIIITALELFLAYERDLRSIHDRFAEIRASQIPVLTNSVWILDGTLVETQLEGLARLPDIEALEVVVNGKAQWSVGVVHSGRTLVETFPLIQHSRDRDLEIGRLVVTASLDMVENRLLARVVSETLSNLVRTVLVAGFALIMFQLTVTRHLTRLARYAESIDIARPDAPALTLNRPMRRSADMLDVLVAAVNSMRANLTAAFISARGNEERITRENHILSELLRIHADETGDLPAFFGGVCERVCTGMGVGSTCIWQFDAAGQRLELLAQSAGSGIRPTSALAAAHVEGLLTLLRQESVFMLPDLSLDRRLVGLGDLYGAERPLRSGIVASTPLEDQVGLLLIVGDHEAARDWHGDEVNFVGAVATLLAAAREAQEKQEAQAELSGYKDRLEQIIAMRTSELTQTNMELSRTLEVLRNAQADLVEREKLASLGSMVAGVAHEANTPIGVGVTAATALKEATERLAEKFATNMMKKSELEAYVDTALRSTDILATNLRRAAELMRSFKQIAVDQSSETVRVIELGTYVNDVIVSLRPEFRKRHHTVEVTIEHEIILETTPSAIWQIISNLVINSIVHGYNADQQGRLEIIVARKGDMAVITYRDDGNGMSVEVSRRVFEPFFTTRRGQGGSGLGLTIAYNLATKTLGGTISCRSAPGVGTEFTITIPIDESHRGTA
jgi:signal transduction histidine kinase